MIRDHSLVQLRSQLNDLSREMGQEAEATPNSWKGAYSPGGGGDDRGGPDWFFIRPIQLGPRAVQLGLKDLFHLRVKAAGSLPCQLT
jgi:hypothetical protein